MHSEAYAVGPAAAGAIDAALDAGRRIVAVGTTSVRVLETVWGGAERGPLDGRTRLLIEPGHRVQGRRARWSRTSTCPARRCSRW